MIKLQNFYYIFQKNKQEIILLLLFFIIHVYVCHMQLCKMYWNIFIKFVINYLKSNYLLFLIQKLICT